MANNLPITIQAGALPPQVRWTPQQLFDAMVQRMSLVTQATFALFVTGSTEPSSNVGPWLKNGNEWYVWSDVTGDYVPISITQQTLGYIIGPTTPDENIYQFWIETNGSGSPLALKTFYSGAWVDVYAAQFANYPTSASVAATYQPISGMGAYLTVANAVLQYQPLLPGYQTVIDGTQNGWGSFSSGAPMRSSRDSTALSDHHVFYNPNGNVGAIYTDTNNTTYNTSSDARLKTDIKDAASMGNLIDAVKVRDFVFKNDPKKRVVGFIAQELVEQFPSAVVVGDEERQWMVDYSKLVPALVKEVQLLRARVAALEAKQ